MSLRIRLLLTISATLLALSVGMYCFASRMIFQDFSNLEQSNALDSLGSARKGLSLLVEGIYSKSGDWSTWDDSYQFMQDRNQVFVQSNLGPTTLKTLNVDLIAFVGKDGKLFYADTVPDAALQDLQATNDLVKMVDFTHLQPLNHGYSGMQGIVTVPQGAMMVAIRPILTSKQTGPARGWIVFGRFLRQEEVAQLQDITGLNLDFSTLSGKPDSGTKILKDARMASNGDFVDRSQNEISAHAIIRDLNGVPALYLTVHRPRATYRQGIAGIEYFILSAFILSAAVYYVVERFALKRLSRLTDDVAKIHGGIGIRHVEVSGTDELGSLATKINAMLSQIHDGEAQLQRQNEGLELTVQERTREIKHQAFHDALTGLANRPHFTERVELAINNMQKSQTAIAIIFLDLDNFKLINDSLGHAAGDRLLCAVSERLVNACRPGDTVARLGGDEFTVLLENLQGADDAIATGQRILENLLAPIRIGDRETFTAASVGLVYSGDATATAEVLLKNADTAMYHAKANGKSHLALWEESMNDEATERLELVTDLRRSMDGQEMFLEYQPLVCLENGRIEGAEALVRWRHPKNGVIPPSVFIPLAEEAGMMIPLGYWILEEACRQALKWQTEFGMNSFTISVNVSGKQLFAKDVVERIAAILVQTGLKANSLKLEITESVLMSDRTDVVEKLLRLKDFGIKLALDDFGTGYSSLARLSSFPVDTLKIDRAFVSRLEEGGDAVDVVHAIMSLSKSMKLNVTGEGIETLRQMEILRELGCDTGQGFYFSRPLSRSDFTDAIMTRSAIFDRRDESIRGLHRAA